MSGTLMSCRVDEAQTDSVEIVPFILAESARLKSSVFVGKLRLHYSTFRPPEKGINSLMHVALFESNTMQLETPSYLSPRLVSVVAMSNRKQGFKMNAAAGSQSRHSEQN